MYSYSFVITCIFDCPLSLKRDKRQELQTQSHACRGLFVGCRCGFTINACYVIICYSCHENSSTAKCYMSCFSNTPLLLAAEPLHSQSQLPTSTTQHSKFEMKNHIPHTIHTLCNYSDTVNPLVITLIQRELA